MILYCYLVYQCRIEMNRDIYAYNFIVRRNLLLVFIPLNKLAAAVICIGYNLVVCYCKQEAASSGSGH